MEIMHVDVVGWASEWERFNFMALNSYFFLYFFVHWLHVHRRLIVGDSRAHSRRALYTRKFVCAFIKRGDLLRNFVTLQWHHLVIHWIKKLIFIMLSHTLNWRNRRGVRQIFFLSLSRSFNVHFSWNMWLLLFFLLSLSPSRRSYL